MESVIEGIDLRGLRFFGFLVLGYFGFLVWDQFYYWRVIEEYSFGYLMPVFVGYVLWERREIIKRSFGGGMGVGMLGVIMGLLLLGFGGLMRAGHGPMEKTSLVIGLGFGSFLLGWGVLVGGWKLGRLFIFPAMVGLVSVPLLSPVELGVKTVLLEKVTGLVYFFYEVLGWEIGREGSVLILPSGKLGVEEACSGIRSLTASVFVGSFLGAVMLDRFWKKAFLVFVGMLLAFVMNVFRSGFLTYWGYVYGVDEVVGCVHDVAGYGVLGITCLGMMAMGWLLSLELE